MVHFTNNFRDPFVGWDQQVARHGPPAVLVGRHRKLAGPTLACAKVASWEDREVMPLLFRATGTGVYARFGLQPVIGPAFMPG